MAKETFIATVQIILSPDFTADESDAAACDAISAILSERCSDAILDWQYLTIGGQLMSPTRKIINDEYEEGDGFI